VTRQVVAMGTRLTLHLEGADGVPLIEASAAAVLEVERIEGACSTWRPDSSWSALNAARGAPVPMAREWLDLLAAIQDWNRRTAGAFDPALMPLLAAWGVREGGRTPSPEALVKARAASGSAQLALDLETGTARLLNPSGGVEEGGFLKGYALDAARREAQQRGAAAGFLDFGGQLLAWGRARRVGIADPVHRRRSRFTLWLRGGSLSSSGCSERGRHILDPRSGLPCPAWGEVSVVAATGLEADVLSTALFVLGPVEGPRWARREGVAALFLPVHGAPVMSPAFRALGPRVPA
jgi:thiamine biosynthesis lipoprotein